MNRKIKSIMLSCLLLLTVSLTACGSKPDMPMEITVDGYTIVLGQTTIKDMTDRGYEVLMDGMPDVMNKGDQYIPFYYSLDRGAGDQIHVTACVPWEGGSDVAKEQSLASTEGIIKSVRMTLKKKKKIDVVYNDVNIKDLSFDYAEDEWKAKEDEEASKRKYKVTAERGFVILESATTGDEDYGSLNVQLTQSEFEKMQK